MSKNDSHALILYKQPTAPTKGPNDSMKAKRCWDVDTLQRGERYAVLDFHYAYADSSFVIPIIGYDICCQCQCTFSPEIEDHPVAAPIPALLGVGMTDGESVERAWAELNPSLRFMREMRAGERRELLDEFVFVKSKL
ncbi:hypothetical protein C8R43DRAFT_1124765 [Mycena crocata]|nr:hypothetical protein C8R43DRAFT_1124765 [Mycena crocata]